MINEKPATSIESHRGGCNREIEIMYLWCEHRLVKKTSGPEKMNAGRARQSGELNYTGRQRYRRGKGGEGIGKFEAPRGWSDISKERCQK